MGAHLVQIEEDGTRHLVICASRTLKPNEKNFSVSEKECAAIVFGLKKFRPFVYGKEIDIITDHAGLRYLMTTKDLTNRLARWSLSLMDYQFKIIYNKGRSHGDADYLSREPFPPESTNNKAEEQPIESYQVTATPSIDFTHWTAGDTKTAQQNDPYWKRIIEIIDNPLINRKVFKQIKKRYIMIDGLLCRTPDYYNSNYRICVPTIMVRRVLHEAHGSGTVHFGQKKTLWRALQQFEWCGLYIDICKYVQTCGLCQSRKPPRDINRGYMGSIDIGQEPFHILSCDIITSLPSTKEGFVSIITAIDQLTKYAFAIPIKDMRKTTLVEMVRDHIVLKFGAPRIFLTDKGANFLSEEMKNFYRTYGIEHRTTTPYHPSGNGECERFNRTLITQIAMHTIEGQDWNTQLQKIVYQYNITQHSVTGYAPLQLLTGHSQCLTIARTLGLKADITHPDVSKLRTEAIEKIKRSQTYNRNLVNADRQPVKLKVGDLIMIEESAKKNSRCAKLKDHWGPPHRVLEIPIPRRLIVQPIYGRKVKKEIHVSHAKRYYSRGDFTLFMERRDPTKLEIKTIDIASPQQLVLGGLLATRHDAPPPSQILVKTQTDDKPNRIKEDKREGYG